MDAITREKINGCLVAINKGEKGAIEELHSLVAPSLRYIALRYLRKEQEADDLVQDFWADIYEIAKGYRFVCNGFGYLCKTMTNRALNRRRNLVSENNCVELTEYIDYRAVDNFASDDTAEGVHTRMVVEEAMQSLNDKERAVLQRIYFEGKTLREIAKELKVSKSTVGNLKESASDKIKSAIAAAELDKDTP